jgi:hypothetical protein
MEPHRRERSAIRSAIRAWRHLAALRSLGVAQFHDRDVRGLWSRSEAAMRRSFLRRHTRFATFVWLTLGAGLAIVLAAGTFVSIESAWPIALRPVVRPTAIPDTTWSLPWSGSAWTASQTQQAGANALLGVLLALAAAATAMAVINVMTLASARSIGRRRERALRAALGAGPRRFVAQRLAENGFIYGIAVVLAAIAAVVLGFAVKATWPAGLDPFENPAIASAAGILVVAFSVLLLKSLTSRSPRDLRGALAGGSATDDRSTGIARGLTVTMEVALAMALACVTALLVRHGSASVQVDGVDDTGIVTLEISSAITTPQDRAAQFSTILDRVHELPGVEAESIASPGAWLGMGTRDRVLAECDGCVRGGMFMPLVPAFPVHHAVSPGFFETFGIPLVDGRVFDATDAWDTTNVAVINEAFAAIGLGRGGPIGKRVRIGGADGDWFTIVGVVGNAVGRGLGAPRDNAPALYLSTMQQPPVVIGLAARTAAEPESFAGAVRSLPDVASSADVRDPASLEERVQRAVAPLRWFGSMFAIIAGAAFGFAVHGVLAAVRAATIAQRRELAVRAAIGAGPGRLLRLVLGRTTRTILFGLGAGLFLAGLAGRTIQLQVGGMPPVDFHAAGPIAALLASAALLGALGPALRASRASPARVFRE